MLLALALTADGAAAGGHYVVAIGIGPNGSVLIRDPSPDFGRTPRQPLDSNSKEDSLWAGGMPGAAWAVARRAG